MPSSQLATILRQYSQRIPVEEIVSAIPYRGFSGADVWKISTPHGSFALRRWANQSLLPPTRLRGLHRLLEHITRQGVDFIAVPVAADSGDTLTSFATHSEHWQLEPWLPGAADDRLPPSDARLQAAMMALARWHLAAATFVPSEETRQWFFSAAAATSPAVDERLRSLSEITPNEFRDVSHAIRNSPEEELRAVCQELCERIRRLHPVIARELHVLHSECFALQPCLRDIWQDHVLFTGDEVTGLIDANACRAENVAADLARLIGSLAEEDPGCWRIALDAYQRVRPLSLKEISLVRALDRSGVVLGARTWLSWLYQSGRKFPEPDKVLGRLKHFQRRLTRLET